MRPHVAARRARPGRGQRVERDPLEAVGVRRVAERREHRCVREHRLGDAAQLDAALRRAREREEPDTESVLELELSESYPRNPSILTIYSVWKCINDNI